MVFSSPIFLFLFLPVVLGLNYLLPARRRNLWLLVASLVFYAWGEVFFVLIMLLSTVANYFFGRWVDRVRGTPAQKTAMAWTIVFNIGLLATFKYANFAMDNLNALVAHFGWTPFHVSRIPLPIGISFFTFHAISYVVDIYRGQAEVQKNPFNVALYIALFSQLIAGPIIRYHDIARQLVHRVVTRETFAIGVSRFIIGLGKKVLIANTAAGPADRIFSLPPDQLTTPVAWLGVLCYTVQIYFDFSGYSDMAIGLGRMFGFHFRENFDFPYVSQSIREFWRRWHISLSSWFRDYLYIPMGGSRCAPWRVYFNLVTVFFLCGLWHGASWTFVVWGLYHGLWQVVERLGWDSALERMPRPLRHVYTLLVVIVGWALFRADSFPQALAIISSMAGFAPAAGPSVWMYLNPEVTLAMAVGIVGSMPLIPRLNEYREKLTAPGASLRARMLDNVFCVAGLIVLAAVLLACVMSLSAGTYNPFIYYRF